MPDIDDREKPILQQFKEVVLGQPSAQSKAPNQTGNLTAEHTNGPFSNTANAPIANRDRPGDTRVNADMYPSGPGDKGKGIGMPGGAKQAVRDA
ncbi:hypothetical protein HDU85_007606 [Gaertneriomyces sp. JEL0708]|nr:hypothetical protein HDU85_007606 [Gaertneriomyces sp. JEL0708]